MVTVVYRAVVLLHKWHQVADKVIAEHVAPAAQVGPFREIFGRVAVWENDNHRLSLSLCDEVVKDEIDPSNLEIYFFRVGGAAYEVEYRIFLVFVLVVERRGVNDGVAVGADGLGPVVHVVNRSVGNVLCRVDKRRLRVADIHDAVLEAFVREPVRVERIHYLDAVHYEAVWVHVRRCRSEGERPYSVLALYHVASAGELSVHLDIFGVVVAIVECDSVVRIDYR
ncbi:uncharacterized protein BN459_00757 [Bacteroides sp. CAG:1060]|nr:uncharacterized protein BN459_00757 [Bacteroides sp. CAG:1060]